MRAALEKKCVHKIWEKSLKILLTQKFLHSYFSRVLPCFFNNLLLFFQILRTTKFDNASQWLLPVAMGIRRLLVDHLENLAAA